MMRISRSSDALLALLVIAVISLLLIPVPPGLIDLLIVVSFAFSLLLLAVALYIPNVSSLFVFPSLLLLTTLFRLGLNVASTRLILLDAYAGEVIQSFGTFLIRGEVVVGVIIFTIITVVNFIVVARGSTRVAEVAARFALDALPGKQSAIDSDMRAGVISVEKAVKLRDELRMESQLYGSMDGAMKFVQGDVIAGIFIIFTNIIGGIYIGISKGLGFADAIQTYTVLTVGDGLVSQIPALLISICAGIVVTRVSSSEDSSLGSDVAKQLFSSPSFMFLPALIMFFVGMLPGLPLMPFWIGGALFAALGVTVYRRQKFRPVVGYSGLSGGSLKVLDYDHQLPEKTDTVVVQNPFTIILDETVLYKLYRVNGESHHLWWKEFSDLFYETTGLKLPQLSVRRERWSSYSSYVIKAGDVIIDRGSLPPDSLLVEANPGSAGVLGIEPASECIHPLTGARVFWALRSPQLRRILEGAGIQSRDFFEYLCLKGVSYYQRHPEEILRLTDVQEMIGNIGSRYPNLVKEVVERRLINTPRLTELLRQLAREGISVRDIRMVLEMVASYYASRAEYRSDGESDDEFDLMEIVNFVRKSYGLRLLAPRLSPRGTLKVLTLSDEVEEAFVDAEFDGMGRLPPKMPQNQTTRLISGFDAVVDPVRKQGVLPVVVFCASDLKNLVFSFLFHYTDFIYVAAYDELDSSTVVEKVGEWRLGR